MDSFETQCVYDENTLKEISKLAVSFPVRAFFTIAAILCLACAVWFYIDSQSVILAVVYILLAAVCLGILPLRRRLDVSRTLKRTLETNGGVYSEIKVSFTENGIDMENSTTRANGRVEYNAIRRFMETERLYLLRTQARQMIPVNRGGHRPIGETGSVPRGCKGTLHELHLLAKIEDVNLFEIRN